MSTWWCHKIKYVTIVCMHVCMCVCVLGMREYVKLHDDCHMWNHFNWFSGHFFTHFSRWRDSIKSVNIQHQLTDRKHHTKMRILVALLNFYCCYYWFFLLFVCLSHSLWVWLCVRFFFFFLSEINHFVVLSRLHWCVEYKQMEYEANNNFVVHSAFFCFSNFDMYLFEIALVGFSSVIQSVKLPSISAAMCPNWIY